MDSHATFLILSRSLTLLALSPLINLPKMYFCILCRDSLMFLMLGARYSINLYNKTALNSPSYDSRSVT